MKNENIDVILITKNRKRNLAVTLNKFGISNIFNDIIHLNSDQKKSNFMEKNSLLIDDSFVERKQAIDNGHYAFGLDCISMLF